MSVMTRANVRAAKVNVEGDKCEHLQNRDRESAKQQLIWVFWRYCINCLLTSLLRSVRAEKIDRDLQIFKFPYRQSKRG